MLNIDVADQVDEKAREQFKQDALKSWASYKKTGLHLTGAEVRLWLKTWGNGDEKEIPPCHT